MAMRNERENRFYKAIRGVDDSCIEKAVPKVVRFLANEISLLGELFIKSTIERSSVVDEKNSKPITKPLPNIDVVIEFESLI